MQERVVTLRIEYARDAKTRHSDVQKSILEEVGVERSRTGTGLAAHASTVFPVPVSISGATCDSPRIDANEVFQVFEFSDPTSIVFVEDGIQVLGLALETTHVVFGVCLAQYRKGA